MLTYDIIEYDESFAAAVAKMWNESREGWGGDQEVETEEDRKTAEQTNGNILTLLAFDGESVIGYCGFSEYKGDEGALYIPLLNVHPKHHGKGVGKRLVLEAVKRTTEQGWPRLDLYTWPGNTKAVPLYKRCGFFWEERDDRVHLLNFIPKILTHSVLGQYVQSSTWYADLKREIEIKPDGEKENGFVYYTYQFETENGPVSAKIEQSGRGISSFSTPDYEVEFTLPTHLLLLSGEYEGTLRLHAKHDSIQLKATVEDHPYISAKNNIDERVSGTKSFSIPFRVEQAPELQQSKWKTHPKISLTVSINGEEFQLEIGTSIQKPVTIEPYLLKDQGLYCLQVKNQLEEVQNLTLNVTGFQEPVTLSLNPLEKQVITAPLSQKEAGEMKIGVQVQSTLSWLVSSYEETVHLAIPSRDEAFVMETPTFLYLYNGAYVMKWSKEDHVATLEDAFTSKKISLVFLHPTIGMPAKHALAKQTWTRYSWEKQAGGIELRLEYDMKEPECTITRIIHWSTAGELTMALELSNLKEGIEDVYVGQLFYAEEEQVVFPMGQSLLAADDAALDLLPLEQISEPWMFINGGSHTFAFEWPNDARVYSPSWQSVFEQRTHAISADETHQFAPLKIGINVFKDWQTFQPNATSLSIKPLTNLMFAQGHGFYKPGTEQELILERFSQEITSGGLRLNHGKDEEVYLKGLDRHLFKETLHSKSVTNLKVEFETGSGKTSYSLKGVPFAEGKVTESINYEHGMDIWTITNGKLTFKVAPDYFPAMYSLQSQTKEWLDHRFPKPGPKSWWNPWGGGVHSLPNDVNLYTLVKQQTTASFIKRKDQWGHQWQGIQLTIDFTNHDRWNGLKLKQYYLTLPECPMVATYYEIEYPNQLLRSDAFRSVCFLDKGESSLSIYPFDSNESYNKSGTEELKVSLSSMSETIRIWDEKNHEGLTMISTDAENQLAVYSNAEALVYETKKQYTAYLSDSRIHSKPIFYCLTDKHQSASGWEWLKQLRFTEGNV
ncbi:GNAT family N-acetyltransferase [Alkalicoccobacillus gibsonii]|uniref:GNAT family N-acetyltransferase n=1 Tax=Alkalicoccobacillus gibsonii TaxID=79881 RepID=UPI003F7C768C